MRQTTEQKIIEAALAVFARRPLATMEQVAEAANVGRATLFRHFSGKKALMRELSIEASRRCQEALLPLARGDGPAMDRLARAVEALIPLGAAFHFLTYEPWHTDDEALKKSTRTYLEEWRLLLEQAQTAGGIDPELPLSWTVTTLDVLLYGAWDSISNGEIAPKRAAALTLRTFLRGVAPQDKKTKAVSS